MAKKGKKKEEHLLTDEDLPTLYQTTITELRNGIFKQDKTKKSKFEKPSKTSDEEG